MSKVFVIGATGVLGRPTASALQHRGHEVHRAARKIEPSKRAHRVDLENFEDIREVLGRVKPDVVVQLTGGTHADPKRLVEANVLPTINLVQAAAELGSTARMVIAGSAAEYGAPDGGLVTENHRPAPLSGYGWVKLVETSVAAVLARQLAVGLTIVRPFNVVSCDLSESSALGNFRSQLLEQTGAARAVTCGRVDVVRDFVRADFVGEAIARLVEIRSSGLVNVCSGVGRTLEDIMRAASELLGVELRFNIDSTLAALPAPDRIVGDPGRLRSLVGLQETADSTDLARELLRDRDN